ncbi:MAG: DUF5716 family protein [Defluviitaleaceae bacterium]|nr:DUF5716 family protein [Defluviitaleaceae bacterium]
MNWKKYRDFFENNKISEDHFVLGIDMGAATSAISYFDPIRRAAEVLDISGGYGKASAPTALQYIADTKEWIFGEYAILNVDGDANAFLLTNFASKMGTGEYIDIGTGTRPVVDIAAIYLKELIANCRNINPKAQIAGIVATVPDFATGDVKNAMLAAFRAAGYERVLIDLIDEREALLTRYFHNKPALNDERILVLDFGARGLRGSIYDISDGGHNIKCLAAMIDEDLSTSAVDGSIYALLADYYCKNQKKSAAKLSETERQQLYTFAHQHKDMILGHDSDKDIKLYFNFTYPPFSAAVPQGDIYGIIQAYGQKMLGFVNDLSSKVMADSKAFNAVICTGGGFEMPWAKKRITTLFGKERVQVYKNSKSVLAEGATYAAAGRLGLLPQMHFDIEDGHKIPCDIGIRIANDGKHRFLPVLEHDSLLWQKPRTVYVILQDENAGKSEIEIFKRDRSGEAVRIGAAPLEGFPARPAGATKISIGVVPKTRENYTVTIKDLGFGEIFPPSGISKNIEVSI